MDEIKKIKDIISRQIGINSTEIKETDCLLNTYNADSLDTIEIVMDMEQEFNIILEDDEIDGVTKVSDIINLIKSKMSK